MRLLAAAVMVVAVLTACGGGTSNPDFKSLYRQQIKPNPVLAPKPGRDPDTKPEAGQHAQTVVRSLGANHYQLLVVNTSDIGFINTFTWLPPRGFRLTAVIKTSDGHCELSAGALSCTGMAIRPPKCACRSGGIATIDFTGRFSDKKTSIEFGVQGSSLRIGDMTPVPYVIPLHAGVGPALDLPICAKGRPSSQSKPCVQSG
jgi:hypothetical protein